MTNGIKTDNPVRQTPKEGMRTYRPKHYIKNNNDEDKSPKTLNDKNKIAYRKRVR